MRRVIRFPDLEPAADKEPAGAGTGTGGKIETRTMMLSPCFVNPSQTFSWVEPVQVQSMWDDTLYLCCTSNLPKQVRAWLIMPARGHLEDLGPWHGTQMGGAVVAAGDVIVEILPVGCGWEAGQCLRRCSHVSLPPSNFYSKPSKPL
jgi:hypothetical protein